MENIKDRINFIKWQILARLPKGSICERVMESIKHNDLLENDPFYYIYWLDINMPGLVKYLMGTYCTNNQDYKMFINWLKENYEQNGVYEINIGNSVIKIPVPLEHDYKCFKAEFLDIIMPSIVKDDKRIQPFLEGPYEYKNVKLHEGDVVLDCGANFGLFSSLASSKNCQVYAFEPTPLNHKNYLSKIESENIKVFNYAISDETGKSLFQCFENNSSCNQLYKENHEIYNESFIYVPTITVDNFVEQNRLNKLDFIKADIEGAERLMLDGASRVLSEYAPDLSICYYHKLDDLKVLRSKILAANPKYEIDVAYKKIYAHVPGRNN